MKGLVTIVLAAATIANAEMAKCKKRDGSLYVGPTPPEDCVPVGSVRPSTGGEAGSSWKPGEFLPTPTPAPPAEEAARAAADAAREKELERRRAITAVAIQSMVVKQ